MWFKDRKQHRIPVLIPEPCSQNIMNLEWYKIEVCKAQLQEGGGSRILGILARDPDAAGIRSNVEASSTLRKD
jgi:hypothetical protein